MIHWKNKPINKLTEQELRQALTDSVKTVMAGNNSDQNSDRFAAFMFGLASGALVVFSGIFIATLI